MALPNNIKDREFEKFRETTGKNTKVAVAIEGDTGLVQGVEYDDIQASYPDSTTEIYSYYLSSVLQASIEVTYTNSSKNVLIRARRV